jgi:hypothetical protein
LPNESSCTAFSNVLRVPYSVLARQPRCIESDPLTVSDRSSVIELIT